jgi:hypothetical protein
MSHPPCCITMHSRKYHSEKKSGYGLLHSACFLVAILIAQLLLSPLISAQLPTRDSQIGDCQFTLKCKAKNNEKIKILTQESSPLNTKSFDTDHQDDHSIENHHHGFFFITSVGISLFSHKKTISLFLAVFTIKIATRNSQPFKPPIHLIS